MDVIALRSLLRAKADISGLDTAHPLVTLIGLDKPDWDPFWTTR
jgi:hypothetical protein